MDCSIVGPAPLMMLPDPAVVALTTRKVLYALEYVRDMSDEWIECRCDLQAESLGQRRAKRLKKKENFHALMLYKSAKTAIELLDFPSPQVTRLVALSAIKLVHHCAHRLSEFTTKNGNKSWQVRRDVTNMIMTRVHKMIAAIRADVPSDSSLLASLACRRRRTNNRKRSKQTKRLDATIKRARGLRTDDNDESERVTKRPRVGMQWEPPQVVPLAPAVSHPAEAESGHTLTIVELDLVDFEGDSDFATLDKKHSVYFVEEAGDGMVIDN
jgi:hypothetical protein